MTVLNIAVRIFLLGVLSSFLLVVVAVVNAERFEREQRREAAKQPATVGRDFQLWAEELRSEDAR